VCDETRNRFLPSRAWARIGMQRQQPGLACSFGSGAQLRAAPARGCNHLGAAGPRDVGRAIRTAAIGDDDFRHCTAQSRERRR
jgi:hypothetical protein